jgi:UDP-glucose 4-epimerase
MNQDATSQARLRPAAGHQGARHESRLVAIVTGAAGFIGSTLVDRLLAEGHTVVGIDNLSTGVSANLEHATRRNQHSRGQFTFVEMDIEAPELAGVVADTEPDLVFHLAAQVDLRASVSDPQLDARSNVLGTINVCEASRRAGVERIVYAASGGSRYGAPTCLPVAESAQVNPLSPCAVAKLAGELYLSAYAQMYGMSSISLVLSNVYGPRQNPHGESGVVAVFGRALIAGLTPTIYGDGTAARDYIYVDDVADAFMCASRLPLSISGTYNIGTGELTTVNEVYQLIAEAMGAVPPPRYAAARTGELHAIALDPAAAGKHLGWKPSVNIAEGVERTVGWLCAEMDYVNQALPNQ